MKKLLFAFLAVAIFACSDDESSEGSGSNYVFEGDVLLKTQAEVDAFASKGYTEINGALTIGTPDGTGSNIVNLQKFNRLRTVKQGLYILHNPNLVSFKGLDNLEATGSYIELVYNDKITNLDGLDKIKNTGVQTTLEVRNNLLLINMEGLGSVEAFGMIRMEENASMVNLKGLGNKTVYSFNVSDCKVLQSVEGLDYSQTEVFEIQNNESLTTLEAASTLGAKVKFITVSDNPALLTLRGFRNAVAQDVELYIKSNNAITDFDGLQGLASLKSLYVANNASLISISGLGGITKCGNINIIGNNILPSVGGLENITDFHDYLAVMNNPELTDFCALNTIFYTRNTYPSMPYPFQNNGYNPTTEDMDAGNCSQ